MVEMTVGIENHRQLKIIIFQGRQDSVCIAARIDDSTLAIFAVGNALALAGYAEPVEEMVEGASQLIEQPQSTSFVLALRIIFALVPIVLVGLSTFFATRYPLTGTVHQRLNKLLTARRSGVPETDAMRAEAADLERPLVGE